MSKPRTGAIPKGQVVPLPFGMTPQELRLLRMLCDGMGNKDIAATCGIGENTVKAHFWRLFQKIGASSRLEAAMFAVTKGLVKIDETGGFADRGSLLIEMEECHRRIEKYVQRSRLLAQQLVNR